MSEKKSEPLTNAERRDLVIQAGMQAIPYVGGSLTTIYFGAKQERRFKRLETFYAEVAFDIVNLKEEMASLGEQNGEALSALLEELNECVEAEPTDEKKELFKNYFKSTLINPIGSDFDKRRHYLRTLNAMSILECEMAAFLSHQSSQIRVGSIQSSGVMQYAIVGAVNQLKIYGFVVSSQLSMTIGGGADNALNESVGFSEFGEEFARYCLNA